ncbi:MAG TPA: hypothetical protein VFE37_20240 [Chloroflexota bacterium]|nr:hypothetical protein [Chloroflexota bacterium]
MDGLERFGTRSVRGALGLASVGLGAVALGRALGAADPLAAWASGLGAVPLGAPSGIALAVVLLLCGALLLGGRGAGFAAAALAVVLLASLLLDHPGTLGANLDLGLLGAALSLVSLPPLLHARLPRRLAALLPETVAGGGEPAPSGAQKLALRVGLALTFLLSGLDTVTRSGWYGDLLTATGGIGGWPVSGGSPTGLLLWLGTGEVFLAGLLVWGPPARLASAIAAVLVLLDLLALHTPSLLAAKAVGLLGAAVAGYCWASGARALENAQIGWLRAAADASPQPTRNGAGPQPTAPAPRGPDEQ